MTDQEYRKILETIAVKENTSVAEVESEMQSAIDLAFFNRPNSLMDEISYKGDKPTPKEMIEFITSKLKNNNMV